MLKPRFYYGVDASVRKVNALMDDSTQNIVTLSLTKGFKKLPRVTVCGIINEDNGTISIGYTICSSKDAFVKEVGRSIALQRASTSPCRVVDYSEDGISNTFFNEALSIEQDIYESKDLHYRGSDL